MTHDFHGGTPKQLNAWLYDVTFKSKDLSVLGNGKWMLEKMATDLPARIIFAHCFRGHTKKLPFKVLKIMRRVIQHLCDIHPSNKVVPP